MLYQKKAEPALRDDLFANPTSEYRGTPFWAWNNHLDPKELTWQIEQFKKMGFGGAHMHSRVGMAVPYLSDEFMERVKTCVEKFEQEGMLGWLYDEDRWPSGTAGGLVTSHIEYRLRQLRLTRTPLEDVSSKEEHIRTGKPWLLTAYDIELDGDGCLQRYTQIAPDAQAHGEKWYAYVVTNEPDPWFNNQTYIDVLNPKAIDAFINITFERYKEVVGDRFGKSVHAIFTDEPGLYWMNCRGHAKDNADVQSIWTTDLPAHYHEMYNDDLLPHLPEIFWELPDGALSQARYRLHNLIAELFASSYADRFGAWCGENGLLLTGHFSCEDNLEGITRSSGDVMRAYRGFQLPGIDMLYDWHNFTTAKQCQSAVHQYNREGMMSELYGVTNWNFPFKGHKQQGDWQAALGVTIRVPHLAMVGMAGEAKRDYPASIGYQSPWYEEYSLIENHFARVGTALTRGTPVVKVGVLHPIESYWMHFGPKDCTDGIRIQMEQNFQNVSNWLLEGTIDYDFICEATLPELYRPGGSTFNVGAMQYEAVVVPAMECIRGTTLQYLTEFKAAGGTVLFIGACPSYVDGIASGAAQALYNSSAVIQPGKTHLLNALRQQRLVEIRQTDGAATTNLIYNMRQDNGCKWLFVAHSYKTDCDLRQDVYIKIKGLYTPELYNTLDGTHRTLPSAVENGWTVIKRTIYEYDSVLLKLTKRTDAADAVSETAERTPKQTITLFDRVPYTLSEPNVLLLDEAEYALDDEPFSADEELLRLDTACRLRLGLQPKTGKMVQPWVIPPAAPEHTITLRFTIESALEITGAKLALEDAEQTEIVWNGRPVVSEVCGYFTDHDIKTVPLPPIQKGRNTLLLRLPFGPRTSTEWCYILGDFNVRVEGRFKTLTAPTRTIGYSDIAGQGLAFYGANITYHNTITTPGCDLRVTTPHFGGHAVKVTVDGQHEQLIAFTPYSAVFEGLSAGTHTVDITVYGNRYNSFGAVHNALPIEWAGPAAWRTDGTNWSYEYNLAPAGMLCAPIIELL